MIQLWILIIAGCGLFLLSGFFAGYALFATRYNEIVNRNNKLQSYSQALKDEVHKAKNEYDALIKDHKDLYSYYNGVRKQLQDQQERIRELSGECVKNRAIRGELDSSMSHNVNYIERIAQLQSENHLMKMNCSTMFRKIKELEEFKIYYSKYYELSEVETELRFQNKRLKDEVSALQSAGISLGHFGLKKEPLTVLNATDSTTNLCHTVIRNFLSNRNSRGGVISDEMGFVIASASEFSDQLAGLSVLLHYCEKMVTNHIAFENISRAIFVNKNNLCLTITPMILNGYKVCFSGLSNGQLDYKVSQSQILEEVITG